MEPDRYPPGGGLAELLEKEREAGVDVFAGVPKIEAVPLPPIQLPPPDWRGEDGEPAEIVQGPPSPGDVQVVYEGERERKYDL